MKVFFLVGLILLPLLIWTYPPATTYVRHTIRGTVHFAWYLVKQIFSAFAVLAIGYSLMLIYYLIRNTRGYARRNAAQPTMHHQFHFDGHPDFTAGGDHDGEFYDFPEVYMPEENTDSNEGPPRRRRRRMISTLLQDTVLEACMTQSQNDVREALLGSITEQFWTPSPTPTESRSRSISPILLTPRSHQQDSDAELMSTSLQTPEATSLKTNIVQLRHDSREDDGYVMPLLEPVEPPTISQNKNFDTYPDNGMKNPAKDHPANVTLHQFPRGLTKPCLSSDAMSLETFIRLTGIPCNVSCDCLNSTGPFITCDGGPKKVWGVGECTKLLKQFYPETTNIFTVDGDRHVASWSIRLILDHLLCCLRTWRWVIENAKEYTLYQPGWNEICEDFEQLSTTVVAQLWTMGFGNKSQKELRQEIEKDFRSLSRSLGSNPFMLGETPTEIDCTAFGILCQFMWRQESNFDKELQGFSNLVQYSFRIRELLWPDWNDQLTPGLKFKNGKINLSLDSNVEEDHYGVESPTPDNSTRFCDQYYQLVPVMDNSDSITTTSLLSSVCNHDPGLGNEEYVVFCTRCRVSRQPVQMSKPIQLIVPDGSESYIDDDFPDMQKISYSSHGGGEADNGED